MSDPYLVSNERAGITLASVVAPILERRGYFMVSGALDSQSKAFEHFMYQCGDQEMDTFQPIDPIGTLDEQRINAVISKYLERHACVLIGACSGSLTCDSRVHIVERHTISIAKRLG